MTDADKLPRAWQDTLTRIARQGSDFDPADSIRPDSLIAGEGALEDRSPAWDSAGATVPDSRNREQTDAGSRPASAWTSVVSRSSSGTGTHRTAKQILAPSPGTADRPYAVRRPLGKGGMGEVVLARQHGIDRDVAIKLLRRHDHPQFQQWFRREAQITAQLEHPQIPPVHDAGDDFLVMKHLQGATLERRLPDLDTPAAVDILLRICDAVQLAHDRGIIHRDLKPANILVGDYGAVYVLDWGLALPWEELRQGKGSELCAGTPQYMAPEIARLDRDAVGPGIDVFGCAAILHSCLTGRPPVRGGKATVCIGHAAEGRWRSLPEGVPARLQGILQRAMTVDPAERCTLSELRTELQSWLDQRAAEERAAELVEQATTQVADASSQPGYAELRRWEALYAEARRLDPALVAAQQGEGRLRHRQIGKALSDGNLGLARHLLRGLTGPEADEQVRILQQAETERAQIARRQARSKGLLLAAAVLFGIALSAALIQNRWERHWQTTQRHLRADELRDQALASLRSAEMQTTPHALFRQAQAAIAAARGLAPEREDLRDHQASIASSVAQWALQAETWPVARAQLPLLDDATRPEVEAALETAAAALQAQLAEREAWLQRAERGGASPAELDRVCSEWADRNDQPILQTQARQLLLRASVARPAELRLAACRALASAPRFAAIPALLHRLDDADPRVQEAAVDALLALDLTAALPVLLPRWDGDLAWAQRNLSNRQVAKDIVTRMTDGLVRDEAQAWREASRYFYYIGALPEFDKALRLAPDHDLNDRIRLLRKNSHWHFRDSSATRPVLEQESRALLTESFHPEAVRAFCNLAWRSGKRTEGWEISQRARRELSPEDFLICAEPCYILARQVGAEDWAATVAIDVLHAVATGFYDQDPHLLDDAAKVLGLAGYRDEAFAMATRSAASFPWVYDLQQRIGEEAAQRGRWLQALQAAEHMARHRPKEAPPWLISSQYWQQSGDEQRALRQLRIGLGYQPRLGDLLIAHGEWLRRNGRPNAALSRFVRAGEMLPGNAGALVPWFELANELDDRGARFAALYEMGYRPSLFPEWLRSALAAELAHHGLAKAGIDNLLAMEANERLALRDWLGSIPACQDQLPSFQGETTALFLCRQACNAAFSGAPDQAAEWLARLPGELTGSDRAWATITARLVTGDLDTVLRIARQDQVRLMAADLPEWQRAIASRWAAGQMPTTEDGAPLCPHPLLASRSQPLSPVPVHPDDKTVLLEWVSTHEDPHIRKLEHVLQEHLPTDPQASREDIDQAHERLHHWPDWDWPVMSFTDWQAGGQLEPAWD